MDASDWEAEYQLETLSSAAHGNLLEVALLLVAQSPPGERKFPNTGEGLRKLVDAIPEEKWMVEVSVLEPDSQINRSEYRLWITPNGDGSIRMEFTSGKQPGYEFDRVLNLWADGEVFGVRGQGSVDMEEIRAEQQAARAAVEGS